MNSDDLIEKLGDDFYELKRFVVATPEGKWISYSIKERAIGETPQKSLLKLLKLVNDRKDKTTLA